MPPNELGTLVLVAWAFAGCGGPPAPTEGVGAAPGPAVPVEPATALPEPVRESPTDAGSDVESSSVPRADAAGRTRVLRVTEVPSEPGSFEGPLGAEPCDFDRSYRGSVGKTPLTVRLAPGGSPGSLTGEVHYDRAGPSLALEKGGFALPAVRFAERGGGLFEGSCDAATGRISGTFTSRGKAEHFELWPRPATWPPLYLISRKSVVFGNFPGCGKVAKPKTVTMASIPGDDYGYAVCPPTDPKARRQALADGGVACTASESAPRVFGVPNATAINRLLEAVSPYPGHAREIKKCWTLHSHDSVTWVMYASADLLTVQTGRSEDYGGAHPMNSTDGGTAIDLRRAKRIALDEVVTDTNVLRDLTRTCAWDYLAVEGIEKPGDVRGNPPSDPAECDEAPVSQLTWDCDPKDPQKLGPMWALLGEGVAVLSHGHAHAMAVLDGRGPVISWAALARAGILKRGSPLEHLFQGVSPAAADAPACTAAYAGSPTLLRWQVVDRGE